MPEDGSWSFRATKSFAAHAHWPSVARNGLKRGAIRWHGARPLEPVLPKMVMYEPRGCRCERIVRVSRDGDGVCARPKYKYQPYGQVA